MYFNIMDTLYHCTFETPATHTHTTYCQHTCVRYGADYDMHNIFRFSTIISIETNFVCTHYSVDLRQFWRYDCLRD